MNHQCRLNQIILQFQLLHSQRKEKLELHQQEKRKPKMTKEKEVAIESDPDLKWKKGEYSREKRDES